MAVGALIRLIIADDHPVIVEGLRRYFESTPEYEVAACVGSIEELLVPLAEQQVDMVVLDVQMPGLTGPASILSIRESGTKIVLFSLLEEDELIASLVQAGAAGFVSKSQPLDALGEALRRAHLGESILSETLVALLARERAPHLCFTPRELDVYRLLSKDLSTKEVAFELGLAPSTVYTYVERIRSRLGVASVAEIVKYAARWSKLDTP